MADPLDIYRLGRRDYGEVLRLQRALCRARLASRSRHDLLLLVEHPPVVTLGRGTKPDSLPMSPSEIEMRGVEVHEVERGGDVTYHGPGQLVGYPVLDLQSHRPDLHWYLRRLEAGLIDALGSLDIPAGREEGLTGVWTNGRKIASIGVHVKQWVTFHGFALNVTTALEAFDLIVPCGIKDVVMTSVARERNWTGDTGTLWSESETAVAEAMAQTFGLAPRDRNPADLEYPRPPKTDRAGSA
ncbi:MAG: lipoyl(octanoyl) transferase LipB [Gemmatimonadales bacterium]|nr:lipoyl(octanoyl) transferase LipB [Gemmatimonadales bacterium]